jgi:hypothetical protein
MRRSIGEQIEAINELSKIVARYAGETIAPALASPAPAPAAEPARPAPARQLTRAEDARPAARQPLSPSAEARGAEAAREPFGRPPGAGLSGNGAPVKPQPIPPAQPLEARPRGNGEGRGWVADLLRRASAPEDKPPARTESADTAKRSPAQVVESLNSLSIDIARAIDHEASIELWDRYKRGERGVFTRRLYTLQGQKTFDELRRKYERDGDFRQAVDNYIGDFERLLAQVSKDDSDPAVSRKYLTSDTGKVYTMLAHAAGRLG